MRFKTLAIMAIVGLFSTSFAYAADDMSTSSTTNNAGSDNIGSNDSSVNTNTSVSARASTPSNPSSLESNSNDDMSADTATGDDDY